MKQNMPTVSQANLLYLLICIAILIGSGLLAPKLGIGTNLWINEYVWILAPAVLLIKLGNMPARKVFKLKKTTKKNIIIGILSAISLWFFAFYVSKATGLFLDSEFGAFQIDTTGSASSSQIVLTLIGMLILAPVCEELLFRGVIQSAYEAHSKKYGFLFSAVLFGMLHVMNSVTEVIPTFLIGLMLGYLVHRTGSIAASMAAHMASNFCALFITDSLGLSLMKTIPLWLHFIAIGGAVISCILLSRVMSSKQNEAEELKEADDFKDSDESKKADDFKDSDESQKAKISTKVDDFKKASAVKRFSVSSIVLFVLSGIFVLCIGAMELYARMLQLN